MAEDDRLTTGWFYSLRALINPIETMNYTIGGFDIQAPAIPFMARTNSVKSIL
ncbi:MAG: hypothetical protein JO025_16635 [Verrucomicrobia bacterium]|nr:hypothetical protein [Verrucomicrobiota bacterium]